MPVAFREPSPTSPADNNPVGGTTSSSRTTANWGDEAAADASAKPPPPGAAAMPTSSNPSFSMEDGEVAGVLEAQNTDAFPSGEASPSDNLPRSNTVLSECSVVDHGAGPPAMDSAAQTASYATAVASVAVHKHSLRELLRNPPPMPSNASFDVDN